ncbi:MAG: glycoside hydrolase family 9 protein, partial [Oscillospiraceae bacterium]|nr:glycoside hydrolase family 9 protein [Oscillospiraceae bacterium]
MSKHFLKRIGAVCTGTVLSLGSVMMNGAMIPSSVSAADGDNYAKLLQYSLYFYDANMCGDMSDCAIEWRGNCHMQDEVVGGFHDAGDHVMFGQPQGYTASTLGWAYYEFKDAFEDTGQAEHLRVITDRFAKFFRDATQMSGGTVSRVLIEKGEGNTDHMYWGAPEQQGDRGRMLWTTGGAANVTAEYAAALAANYVNFKNPADLEYAKALYEFSKKDTGYYVAGDFYDGHWTGSADEIAWAACWLYLATNDGKYLDEVKGAGQSYSNHSWESVQLGAGILKGEITGDWGSTGFLNNFQGNNYCFLENWEWGSARQNSTAQFCTMVAAKNGKGSADWAKGQMQYITGDKAFANGQSFCLVCGFKPNASKNPHHRAASGTNSASEQNDGVQNKYTLIGALCGGPVDANGTYKDVRSDYKGNEVALDYNAGFVGAAAGLYHFYKTGSIDTSITGVKKIYNGSGSTGGDTTTSSQDSQSSSTTTSTTIGGNPSGGSVSFSKASDVDNNPKWVVQT